MDLDLLRLLQGLLDLPGVRWFCWFVDQPWAGLLLAALVVGDVARRKGWWELPAALAAVIAADSLCARLIKPLLARPRPCAEIETILAPLGCGAGFSMPSCHAANAFALAMVVQRPWAFWLAALIALSRTVAGQHYPSDIVAGAALGLAVGWPLRRALERLDARRRLARGRGRGSE